MLRPDTKIHMKELYRLNRHDIGVSLGEYDGKDDLTRAILIHGESIVQVRADESGIVTGFVPSTINDDDVPHIQEAIEYTFATLLVSENC
jgi:hypothetical protein